MQPSILDTMSIAVKPRPSHSNTLFDSFTQRIYISQGEWILWEERDVFKKEKWGEWVCAYECLMFFAYTWFKRCLLAKKGYVCTLPRGIPSATPQRWKATQKFI